MQAIDDARRLGMLADLLERLPSAVAYLAGPDHVFVFANHAYRLLIGGREVVGRPVAEALPEVDGQGYFEILDEVRRTGEPAEGREAELAVRNAAGDLQQVFVDFVYEPVRESHGSVAGILVHAQDVTAHVQDRRRVERMAAELSAAHERYRTLFETMQHGVVYHDGDGTILAANPAAGRSLGLAVEDLVGRRSQSRDWEAVRDDGSPFPGDEHPAMVALRTGEVVADVVMGVRHAATGERRWLAVTAVPDAPDEHGRPRSAYAMFRDVTELRRAAAALNDRDRLLGRLRDTDVLGVVVASEDGVLDANGAFLSMFGYTQDDLASGRLDWRAMTPPEWSHSDEHALEQLRATGACDPFEKELLDRSGRRVPIMLGAAVVEREPLTWVTFVTDLSERDRAEQERARLVASAQEARIEARGAQERLGLVLAAGDLVAATHSRENLLEQVTRLVVPALADEAIVFLPTEDGSLRATATQGLDAAASDLLRTVLHDPLPAKASVVFESTYRTGTSRLVQDVARHRSESPQLDPRLGELADRLDLNSIISVALSQGTEQVGVLALGRSTSRSPFTPSDVAVAEELGRRIAVGLTNVDTFTREHSVSEILQRAVLPDVLPTVPGVELAVVYLPATEGVDVGGDWYDAFPVGEGRLGIVLGDVVGHSLDSASAMNQLRNALRALAVDDPDPAAVLRRTNAATTRLLPEALATVFYGVLDVGTGMLTYANAGHPPPLVLGAEGPRFLEGARALMLGVVPEVDYSVATERLEPGSGLLLYSDGLVENRSRPLGRGLDALAGAFAGYPVTSAEAVCGTAQAALLPSGAGADDVCLLAVRLGS